MLKDHGDAKLSGVSRTGNVDSLTVEKKMALIGDHRAKDNFHERTFTRSIFAKYRQNLTRHYFKRNIPVSNGASVSLGDVLKS